MNLTWSKFAKSKKINCWETIQVTSKNVKILLRNTKNQLKQTSMKSHWMNSNIPFIIIILPGQKLCQRCFEECNESKGEPDNHARNHMWNRNVFWRSLWRHKWIFEAARLFSSEKTCKNWQSFKDIKEKYLRSAINKKRVQLLAIVPDDRSIKKTVKFFNVTMNTWLKWHENLERNRVFWQSQKGIQEK